MRKLLSMLIAVALVLTMWIVPTASNASPGDPELKLDVIDITWLSINKTIDANNLIKLVEGEKYRLHFRITMVPPTTSEIRVRFPQSSIQLTMNGVVVPFRHRELYKYQTSKGTGEFLVADCFAEFQADATGKLRLEIKGKNAWDTASAEISATASYSYTPSTYAEIITHQMRVKLDPGYSDFASKHIFEYGENVYPTDLNDNGAEEWDLGSGITFRHMNPPKTEALLYDAFVGIESEVERAYCQATVGGILRAVRFRYPDGSIDDYLMLDNGTGPVLCEMLITCPEDAYPGNDPVPNIDDTVHYVYCVTDPAEVQGFFNKDSATIDGSPTYNFGQVPHGGVISDLLSRLPALPDGAVGWTENGADLYDFDAPITRRILLYPLFRHELPSFAVIYYTVGDAEFYWAYEDLYGGYRADTVIAPPPAPIPNDSSQVFSHWINEKGFKVDLSTGVPMTGNARFYAVYEKKPEPPITTTTTDGGVDYFPPVSTTPKPTATTTTEEVKTTLATTAAPITTSSNANIGDEDVPLGNVTTTTPTTLAPTTSGEDKGEGKADIALPVTGLTANEVFWIGGGLILILGIALLIFNKKNESKMS